VEDVGLFLFHQANDRITSPAMAELGCADRTWNTIAKYANTTSASIPLGYVDAVEHETIKDGKLVNCVVFGGGLTWGNALFTHRAF
jgi:3-oxoacyl-[acyl-carrier-protein] synthase-3